MEDPGNHGNQQDQQHDQHSGNGQGEGFDSGLEAYAHSADQSMGYLETEQQGQPPQPGIYAGERQITGDATATSRRRNDTSSGEARLAFAEQSGDTGQANPAPMPQVDTDAPTAEQGQAQPPRIEETPPGGNTAAEQVLQRDTPELRQQQQQSAQARGRGQSGGRKQPAGTVMPTDKHAEAMLDARTRIHDAIDQLASQIPYGEEFAQQAREATDTALDTMEAQALEREAELSRDVTATP